MFYWTIDNNDCGKFATDCGYSLNSAWGTSSCQVCFNDLMQLFILMTGKNAALSYLFIWGLKNMIVEFQLWNLLADKNLVWH